MPWLIPGQGGAFGFVPYSASYGENFQVNYYMVTSSESQIFPGDPVTLGAAGITNVQFPIARLTSSASGTLPILGIAAHGLAAGGGSSAATFTTLTSALLLVYDSPDQMFYANDSSSAIISSTQVGRNALYTAAAGSTAANRSGYFLTGATSSNPSYPFRLQSIHPASWIVGGPSTAGGGSGASTDIRAWVVKPVNHYYGQASTSIAT